ncbi:hypothetical protein G7Z17_g11757 [Cylindrodendrum hubeiense]|uniref:SnoaL-like domain-containing protein n=1 Tax=Cylindrodendrum hubeiense TaxID=595255 RepID=A0A9P5H4G0_9HYPO|nr:hypothetical protein G7Z17_g11757 [Cylindrodendrum hubeiense]
MVPASTLIDTATSYLKAISTVDHEALAAIITESFNVTLAPESTGLGTATRSDLIGRFKGLQGVVTAFGVNIKQTWPNEATNQVIVWTFGDATFKSHIIGDDDPEEWVWKSENIFIFTMDSTGEKVEHLLEFCDSKGIEVMGKLFTKAFERLGAAAGST